MIDNNKNSGLKTDAFLGALAENEQMNKTGKVQKTAPETECKSGNAAFITDAFLEALKINEERNKKHGITKEP